MTQDALLQELTMFISTSKDDLLAEHYAPQIRFDAHEPFFPLAVGYTLFRLAGQSPSSKFMINPNNGIVIEYAIWWDWEIQHLYELEHIWVYLDATEKIIRVEASAHGSKYSLELLDGSLPLKNGHIIVYSEPGKHGFASTPEFFGQFTDYIKANCSTNAGKEGIHTCNLFGADAFGNPTPLDHRLAKRYMQRLAFVPLFEFIHIFELSSIPIIPWPQLQAWIPKRIKWWREQLSHLVPHLELICLDSGDTLIDEETEVKEEGIVLEARFIPGATELIQGLQNAGYTLALVADGPVATFENIYRKQHKVWNVFSAFAISEAVGAEKPDPRIFQTALNALNIMQEAYPRVVMVGNNLSRDIKGANALGLISVWLSWSTRRSHLPADYSEIPDFRITTPIELIDLLEQIEIKLPRLQ